MINRRAALASIAGLIAAPAFAAEARFDAVVGAPQLRARAPAFPTLGAAIDAAPAEGTAPYRILIGRGTWREKLTIAKPFVHLIGEDRGLSIVTFDAASGHAQANGEAFGTRGCATLIVQAGDFAARNLTIANGFDYVANLAKAESDPTRLADPQGVALMLDAGANRTLIEDVDLSGHQDTLFLDRGLALIRRCRIAGSVDFVFGAGRALIQGSELVSRFRPGKPRQGYIAAPSTPAAQPVGLVFRECRLTREPEVPSQSVVLGRAWRPSRDLADGRYGDPQAVGAAAFIACWMDDHVSADGWDAMGYTAKSGERVFLQPEEARLVEFGSRGPGARASARRRTLSAAEAAAYAPARVLDGWPA